MGSYVERCVQVFDMTARHYNDLQNCPIACMYVVINQRLEILGSHYLEYEDLALLHRRPLLRLAKA